MTDPILKVDQITKRFGALTASDAVSLDLRAGEIHALIGPNGAGKSTLIAQIAGALTPDAGRVVFDGQDVTPLPVPKRARIGLARTFQISQLAMDHTVLENVMMGVVGARGSAFNILRPILRHSSHRADAEAAIARVGLADATRTRAAELSHGQRRQLEVAIALTLNPKALLLDEPMAGLGAEGTAQMVRLLDTLRHDAPILLVEHDMDAVFQLADRISVLVYGRIIATGTPAEIRQNADVRDAYLGDDAA